VSNQDNLLIFRLAEAELKRYYWSDLSIRLLGRLSQSWWQPPGKVNWHGT